MSNNIKLFLFISLFCFNAGAQTGDELLKYRQLWSQYEEVEYAYIYKRTNQISESKTTKKSNDYILYLDDYSARPLFNNEAIGNLVVVKKDGKYGYVNCKGKKVIPIEYETARPVTHLNSRGEPVIVVKKNGKYGALNSKNKTVLDFEYDAIYTFRSNRILCFKNNKYTYLDPDLKPINDVLYDDAFNYFVNGLAHVVAGNKHGLIDTAGKIVLPMEYDNIYLLDDYLSYRYLIVYKEKKAGIVDSTGKLIIPTSYDKITLLPHNINNTIGSSHKYYFSFTDDYKRNSLKGFFYARAGKDEILLDRNANTIIAAGYTDLKYRGPDQISAKNKEGKYGLLDFTGKNIAPFRYDDIDCFIFNRSVVKVGEKFGLLKQDGTECVSVIFSYMNFATNYNMNDFGFTDEKGQHKSGWIMPKCIIVFDKESDSGGDYSYSAPDKGKSNTAKSNSSSGTGSGSKTNTGSKTNIGSTPESGFSGSVKVINDTGKEVHLFLKKGGSGWWSAGSSKTVHCEEGEIVYVSLTNKSSDKVEAFKVTEDMCGKTIKLSKYYK